MVSVEELVKFFVLDKHSTKWSFLIISLVCWINSPNILTMNERFLWIIYQVFKWGIAYFDLKNTCFAYSFWTPLLVCKIPYWLSNMVHLQMLKMLMESTYQLNEMETDQYNDIHLQDSGISYWPVGASIILFFFSFYIRECSG